MSNTTIRTVKLRCMEVPLKNGAGYSRAIRARPIIMDMMGMTGAFTIAATNPAALGPGLQHSSSAKQDFAY